VNADCVLLIKPDDKFILFEFPYDEIESLLLDPSDNFITLNLVSNDVTGFSKGVVQSGKNRKFVDVIKDGQFKTGFKVLKGIV
jgi:hypothetical protein